MYTAVLWSGVEKNYIDVNKGFDSYLNKAQIDRKMQKYSALAELQFISFSFIFEMASVGGEGFAVWGFKFNQVQ
jgi:nitrate reductase NapE component